MVNSVPLTSPSFLKLDASVLVRKHFQALIAVPSDLLLELDSTEDLLYSQPYVIIGIIGQRCQQASHNLVVFETLKGSHRIAQGNALGTCVVPQFFRPEGAKPGLFHPFGVM